MGFSGHRRNSYHTYLQLLRYGHWNADQHNSEAPQPLSSSLTLVVLIVLFFMNIEEGKSLVYWGCDKQDRTIATDWKWCHGSLAFAGRLSRPKRFVTSFHQIPHSEYFMLYARVPPLVQAAILQYYIDSETLRQLIPSCSFRAISSLNTPVLLECR